LADVSESMYPWRIFLKKAIYFALMDIESFVYTNTDPGSSANFSKVRIALVKYHDRKTDSKPVEFIDFVEYKNLDLICKGIDQISIEKKSVKKRAVFDGLKAVKGLSWTEGAMKVIVHFAADPQYGTKYTTNPKKMTDDYDAFPDGVDDIDEDDLFEGIKELSATFNLVKLGDRMDKYSSVIKTKFDIDANKPEVDEL